MRNLLLTLMAAVLLAGLWYLARTATDGNAVPSGRGDSLGESDLPKEAPKVGADGIFHVRPGDDLQAALDAAANSDAKTVHVHAGIYRPPQFAQAMIRFNRQHDGIVLEAQGDVVLTAANPSLGHPDDPDFPAVVNHVVYFGDGVGPTTTLRGFTITGANRFVTTDLVSPMIEPDSDDSNLKKGVFFFADGGAIKIFGRSSPTLENLLIKDNRAMICAGGISVEQRGYKRVPVTMRNIRFLGNRCGGTGAAVDLLGGSYATLENCLFVGNIGNTDMDEIAQEYNLRYNSKHGCGALTVFPESRVEVRRCTFTKNWNGVDDHGDGSVYERCIFWDNDKDDGSRPGKPYEIDTIAGTIVHDCAFGGNDLLDLRGTVNKSENQWNAPDPGFDAAYRPTDAAYQDIGFRPMEDSQPTRLYDDDLNGNNRASR